MDLHFFTSHVLYSLGLATYNTQICLKYDFLNETLSTLFTILGIFYCIIFFSDYIYSVLMDITLLTNALFLFLMGSIYVNCYIMAAVTCFVAAYYIYIENISIIGSNSEILSNSFLCGFIVNAVYSQMVNKN